MSNITALDFDTKVLQNPTPVVVMFFSNWCSKCSMMKPVFEEIERNHKNHFCFFSVDIDKNPELFSKFSGDIVPTFSFFKDGQILADFSGVVSESVFEKRLMKIFINC